VVSPFVDVVLLWSVPAAAAAWLFAEEETARRAVRKGLALAGGEPAADSRRPPLTVRLVRSTVALGRRFGKSSRRTATLQERISAAGNPWRVSAEELAGLMLAGGAAAATVTGLAVYALTNDPARALLTAGATAALAQTVPPAALSAAANKRRMRLERDLPDFVDLLTLMVEAGTGFDRAVTEAAARFDGPVGDEFARAMREVRMGVPKHAALSAIADRNPAAAGLAQAITAITQAERYGIGIAAMLRSQSDQLRKDRKQRTEENVQKLPLKMMFPLVFLILPALFVVILGPAVIEVMRSGMFK